MLRSYWCLIIAAFFSVAGLSTAYGQTATSSNEVAEKTKGTEGDKQETAASATFGTRLDNGKQFSEPDCGTPKECRAEQREKDDLIAQQTSAKAATDQANLLFWQTAIASIGVLAVIATLIYTHMATAAAVGAVALVTQAEKGMLSVSTGNGVFTAKDNAMGLNLFLSNVGKTAATLSETCFYQTSSNRFEDFSPSNVLKHNTYIIPNAPQSAVDFIPLYIEIGKPMLVVGYYKWQNSFEKREYCDYFCCGVTMENGTLLIIQVETDDWPPDCK